MARRRLNLNDSTPQQTQSDLHWIDKMGNLVLFNGSVSKDTVMGWCAIHAVGAYIFVPADLTMFVRPKVNDISGIVIPPSQVPMKAKFAIIFESADDITRLKLTL